MMFLVPNHCYISYTLCWDFLGEGNYYSVQYNVGSSAEDPDIYLFRFILRGIGTILALAGDQLNS